MRSISSSVKYSFLCADIEIGLASRAMQRLRPRSRILSSEHCFQDGVSHFPGNRLGLEYGIAFVEAEQSADVFELPELAPDGDFEILKPARLPMSIAAGSNHGLMGRLDHF